MAHSMCSVFVCSESLLQLYLQYGLDFHAGCVDMGWQRYLTPPGASMFARQNLARQMAHQYWTQQQVSLLVA